MLEDFKTKIISFYQRISAKTRFLFLILFGILVLTVSFLIIGIIYFPQKQKEQKVIYPERQIFPFDSSVNQELMPTSSDYEFKMTSDFKPCLGIDKAAKNPIAYHRILLAKSADGLHFTRMGKLISDRASVPDIMVDKKGNVRIYFVLITCKEQGQDLENIPVVAISSDNGENWVYKKLTIEAPSDALHCKTPGGSPAPVDPEVLLMPDGTYRLYATCPQSNSQGTPMTYVFFSSDGIYFSGAQHTYIPQNGIALDPVVIKFGNTWNLFNGNSNPATSLDGITFNNPKPGIFCPFKFKDGNTDKCYVIGDALTLGDSLGYRIYLFGDTPNEGFKSIFSSDGENWTMEQKSNEYILNIDQGVKEEYYKLMFPTVTRLNDGSFLMAYETFIPQTPPSIFETTFSEKENDQLFKSFPEGGKPTFGQKEPLGKCGDGICDSIEQTTNTCPLDCLR